MLEQNNMALIEGQVEGSIALEPPAITFANIRVEAELTAQLLAETTPGSWVGLVARLLEMGAEAESMRKASIATQLIERRLESFAASLEGELGRMLRTGGDELEERILRALQQHERELIAWTTRFTDPDSQTGLPELVSARLRHVGDAVVQQVNLLLTDSDAGAFAKFADRIAKQVRESERNILAQVIARQVRHAAGIVRGKTFEEALSVKLCQVAAAMGCQVDRVGDRLGTKRTRKGDHLLTLDDAQGEAIRIAIEGKSHGDSHRFGFESVRKECEAARANRDAHAAVFVCESRESLPDGVCFGHIGRADYFVQFDPATGEDIALVAALYLARAAALETVRMTASGPVDRAAAKRLVDDVRQRVERRSRIHAYHNSAVKAIHSAAKSVDEDADAILAALARLDSILVI